MTEIENRGRQLVTCFCLLCEASAREKEMAEKKCEIMRKVNEAARKFVFATLERDEAINDETLTFEVQNKAADAFNALVDSVSNSIKERRQENERTTGHQH